MVPWTPAHERIVDGLTLAFGSLTRAEALRLSNSAGVNRFLVYGIELIFSNTAA